MTFRIYDKQSSADSAVKEFQGFVEEAKVKGAAVVGRVTALEAAQTGYATSAQGALADTALQQETLTLAVLQATVANSTTYADLQSQIAALS